MSDWEAAVSELTWLVRHGQKVDVGTTARWDRPSLADLPQLTRLLTAARVTPVTISEKKYDLLGWGRPDGRSAGWLCFPPAQRALCLPVLHQVWQVLGGIVEIWGAPDDTWLLNQNNVLTPSLADSNPTDVLHAYRWAWEQEGLELPIDSSEYGVLAEEANGNLTLFHRATGEVLLFAPDHDFDNVEPLRGCPEYTLYRIPSAPTVDAWLECVAAQWWRAL